MLVVVSKNDVRFSPDSKFHSEELISFINEKSFSQMCFRTIMYEPLPCAAFVSSKTGVKVKETPSLNES
jgi:hypothetical protein